MAQLRLQYQSHLLALAHTFTLSHSSRTHTPITFVAIQWEEYTGFGEAAMPPYLGETPESSELFYASLDFSWVDDPGDLASLNAYIDAQAAGHTAAKAALDIALHDLHAKRLGIPLYSLFGLNPSNSPTSSYTIGIHPKKELLEILPETKAFGLIKVKLGGDADRETIQLIREYTDKPLSVDVNQGWRDEKKALDEIFWLKEQGVIYVEQPMPKETTHAMEWLTEQSPLPTIADEAVQRLVDIPSLVGRYSGVNIKLMKCTGVREAFAMIQMARAFELKVMIGCMTESSCGIAAAAHLSALADWVDLDGHFLLAKDPFEGLGFKGGIVQVSHEPGLGVRSTGLNWDD